MSQEAHQIPQLQKKTAFTEKRFYALYPRAEVNPCRKDTSSSRLCRAVVPRARRIFPEQRKQRNSSKPREKSLGFRADVPCSLQSLQSSCTHCGGPFGPVLPSHVAASYHGTAASMSLAPWSISKHEANKHFTYVLQGSETSRLPKAPNAKPTVGSTGTSALGITSWPARSLLPAQTAI